MDPNIGSITGDSDRIKQVIWNLLSNAVKFTPPKGRVTIEITQDDSYAKIRVRDTGQGIRPDFLPHVFERFRQADGTITRGHGGLGLGLAIVRHLVELHGGAVQAESPGEGQGSTFTVNLPLMAVPAEVEPEERTYKAGIEKITWEQFPRLDNVRILLVEDETDTQELITEILERCGAQVKPTASATEALEIFGRWNPDILVSDIGLPGEDGYELLKKIRAMESGRGGRVPAVALTAFARSEDRIRALATGYQLHVPKPVEPIELAAAVAGLVRGMPR